MSELDEQVRIAVKALGDIRNGKSNDDDNNNKYSPPPSSEDAEPSSPPPPPQFVSRVSHIPLVSTALRAYEQGKNSSRVVKYGAGLVESSVKTISRPVIDRLPVDSLDEFACRQLDRLESYRTNDGGDKSASKSNVDEDSSTELSSPGLRRRIAKAKPVSAIEPPTSPPPLSNYFQDGLPPLSSTRPRAPSISQLCDIDPQLLRKDRHAREGGSTSSQSDQQSVMQQSRSRWQAVLLEAGGFSAALSEESMRRLKYCLHWLQYATAHIDSQILILRDFVAALQPLPPNGQPSLAHMRTLTEVRRDVVRTIRQVVDVVSKYAGSALPEPARVSVRGFILKLPQRWASAAGEAPGSTSVAISAAGGGLGRRTKGSRSTARSERGTGSSSTASPMSSRASSPRRHPGSTQTAGAAVHAAQKILALSAESLDMMRGVTAVVKDSLDRAEAWVGRLRAVGIQRGTVEGEDAPFAGLPSFQNGFREAGTMGARRLSSAYAESSAPSTPGGPAGYDSPVVHVGGTGSAGQGSVGTYALEYPGKGSWTPAGEDLSIGVRELSLGAMGRRVKQEIGEEMEVDERR